MSHTEPGAPKGRVLVVDDEDAVASILVQLLRSEGYDTARAAGFDDVQRLCATQAFDVMTLDIMMPGTDGLGVLAWLRQHRPDVGVIMASALGDLDTVIQAMRQGAYSYLLKPFNLDLVVREIERAMERQRLVAQNRDYQQHLERKVEAQTAQLRRAYQQLERQVRELEARDRLVHLQAAGTSPDEACVAVLEALHHALACSRGAVYRVAGEQVTPVAALGLEAPGVVRPLGAGPLPADLGADLVERARRTGEPVTDGAATAVCLRHQDLTLGVLWADGVADDDARSAMWRLADEAAMVLWTFQITEQLDSGQVEIDQLLGME